MTGAAASVAGMRVRAYPLAHSGNRGKLEKVRALLGPWREALCGMQAQLHRAFLNGAVLEKRMGTKAGDLDFGTVLSARQVKSGYNQAYAALGSWQELLKSGTRELIAGSSLDPDVKTVL
ncbi:hypothetical protein ACFQ36_06700 [Arthrobacter sp. GCM10027362]|uniref:hypothetical protein n=1 Tax=Arthrobacter sp. GCM10027362 TaxID=3273379 RepID=UPI003635D22E